MRNPNTSLKARRSLRLSGYDYRQDGIYFITLCTYQNAKLFGAVYDGEMTLSELGEIVSEEWRRIPKIRKDIKLDHFAVLPNHFHGLVVIDKRREEAAAACKSAQPSKESRTLLSGSLGVVIGQFKLAVGRQARRRQLHPRKTIWQRNYYDHIVRSEDSLNEIRRYIIENPARWREDSLYVD